jgi:hypothetical protein
VPNRHALVTETWGLLCATRDWLRVGHHCYCLQRAKVGLQHNDAESVADPSERRSQGCCTAAKAHTETSHGCHPGCPQLMGIPSIRNWVLLPPPREGSRWRLYNFRNLSGITGSLLKQSLSTQLLFADTADTLVYRTRGIFGLISIVSVNNAATPTTQK